MIGTYQTRVTVFRGMDRAAGDAALSAYGELYGRMQRKLFAEVRAGRPAASLKRAYVKDHEIPARMFNGVTVSLEGKIASAREAQEAAPGYLAAPHSPGGASDILMLERRAGGSRSIRSGAGWPTCNPGLAGLEADIAAGRVRLCFGSRRLWRKQHHLEANGYASHEEWLADWQDARSGEFFVLGSRDETGGCQLVCGGDC